MGSTVPPGWPSIDPTKYYCVTTNVYWWDGGTSSCGSTVHLGFKCCVLGSQIITWFSNGGDCVQFNHLCELNFMMVERLLSIEGPYDNQESCEDYCLV